jgi:hypothetical protein
MLDSERITLELVDVSVMVGVVLKDLIMGDLYMGVE